LYVWDAGFSRRTTGQHPQASQFSLVDVEVLTATVDLDEVATYRASMMSRTSQAAESPSFPGVDVELQLSSATPKPISRPIEVRRVNPITTALDVCCSSRFVVG
jgi:hypothetical protein